MLLDWKSKNYLYYKIMQFCNDNKDGANRDLEKLCRERNWFLIPYPKEKFQIFKSISKDGFTVKDGNNFFINYNPELKEKYYGRYRFTLAHEIGHIYLYHHIYVDDYVLMHCDDKKTIWEQHADIFAQNLLMPADKTRELKDKMTIDELAKHFKVSRTMATVRLQKLREDELNFRRLKTKELLSVADRSEQYGSYFFKY